ncbi:Ig-like domain-containing protein [Stenotrophomonas sp. Iso1]|uniref:Ig-like domain-containing protein n=1 Tax=Stenotrophomonas sp. Iso1 TaxID=2977283 RepID=UPI0022B79DEC|nr:Ig-like domain-containing protein [Stenotrophomonas sp. Iso1]
MSGRAGIAATGIDPTLVIKEVLDDKGGKQGAIANGGVTDDSRPEITGAAGAGVVVHVYNSSELMGHVTVGANGEWSFIPNMPLADGRHEISVIYEYPNGDVSEISAPHVIIVDKIAPDMPIILGMVDDEGRITGTIASEGVTDDNRPVVDGTTEPNATVIVYDKDKEIGRAQADSTGKWSFTPEPPLADGTHVLKYVSVDEAGNQSPESASFEFVVDTRPELVSIDNADDDFGSVTGTLVSGSSTDDATPTLHGAATAGGIVTIYEGSVLLGQTTAGVDGRWTFTPQSPLSEGAHALQATVTLPAKGESDRSPSFNLVVDLSAPDAPTINEVYDNVGVHQGPLENGAVTDDSTPTLKGKAEAGSTVQIYDEGNLVASVVADAGGNWIFTPATPLAEGKHTFTVTATDKVGNTSVPSGEFVLTADYTAPDTSKLAITGLEDDVGGIQGNIASGGTTDDSRPVLSGTGTAGDTVIVMVKDGLGQHELGRAIVDENGKWTLQVTTPLISGANEFTAIERDPAGNTSAPTVPYTVIVDTGRPEVPVIENVQDDVGVVHMLQKGEVTNDDTPTIIGTAQAGNLVKIYDGATLLGEVEVGANGKWEFTPQVPLIDGPHTITATATNKVGQTSDATGPWGFVVDATAPGQVTDLVVTDNAGEKLGSLVDGDITDDNTPEFAGKAEPGATVNVYDGDTLLGSAEVGQDGSWTFTPSKPLEDGKHDFTTEVVDPAGNSSGKGPVLSVTVDTTDVTVAISTLVDDQGAITGAIMPNGVTDDMRPEIQGTGKVGSTIKVYDGATLLGETDVKPDGTWSFIPKVDLSQGAHAITATATDTTGNVSKPTASFIFSIDTLAPDAPSIDLAKDDVGAKQEDLSSGAVTDDPSPTLVGKAEAGSTVNVYDNGAFLGKADVDAQGNWSLTPTTPLSEGEHTFTATATDKAGNTGVPSGGFVLTTDYTAPDASKLAITGVEDDVGGITGNVASGATTDDDCPLLSGTGTAGDTIFVMVKDGQGSRELGQATVDADGKWTLQVTKPLAAGSNEFTAIEMDPAGNKTAPSAPHTVIVDTSRAEVPVIESIKDDVGVVHLLQKGEVTNDDTPTISGTAQANNVIKIYDGATLLGEALAGADGTWEFTPGTALIDGPHNITATATNPVGQTSAATDIWDFVVDITAPGQVTDLVVNDNVGDKQAPLVNGDITDDNTPEFTGKAEPGATVNVYDGDTLLGSATVDGNGDWSFTPSTPLEDGAHTLTTEVVDPAGNSSGKGPVLNVTVDTSPVTLTIEALVDDQGAITGVIAPNSVTDDTRPEIQGLGKVGSVIKVYDGSTLLGQTNVKPDGTWSFTPEVDLSQGAHAITATATDKTGNVSAPTASFEFTVDTVPATTPSIGNISDDVGQFVGFVLNGRYTDDANPTISGKGVAGEKIEIRVDGELIGSTQVGVDGRWKFTAETALSDGMRVITAVSVSAAGIPSEVSNEFKINLDTKAPDAPTIETVIDDVGVSKGELTDGEYTDDRRPTFNGKAEPGATVIVYDNGDEVGDARVDTNGNWTWTPSVNLTYGEHEFTFEPFDTAGNIGGTEQWTLIIGNVTRSEPQSETVVQTADSQEVDAAMLTLNLSQVLNDGGVNLFYEGDQSRTQMMVKGGAGDSINLDDLLDDGLTDLGDWAAAGNQTVDGVSYTVYQHSGANVELLVQEPVTVNLI